MCFNKRGLLGCGWIQMQTSVTKNSSHCCWVHAALLSSFVRSIRLLAEVMVRWLCSIHSPWVWTAVLLQADDSSMDCNCETHQCKSLQHSKMLARAKTRLPGWINIYDRDTLNLKSPWQLPCSAVTVVGPILTLTVFHEHISLVLPFSIFDIIPHLSPLQWQRLKHCCLWRESRSKWKNYREKKERKTVQERDKGEMKMIMLGLMLLGIAKRVQPNQMS